MKIYILDKKIVAKIISVMLLVIVSVIFTGIIDDNGIMSVFSTSKELPIYYVDTQEKKIAISFDAAWGTEFTDDILDTLDKYNVKTTFFLVDFWVKKYPDVVKEIDRRGHEIGNHSTNHPYMSKLDENQIIQELKTTEERIKNITGKRTTLFRPPFGDYNDRLIRVCRDNGYYVIQWDVDSLDWKEYGVQPVVDRVTRNVKNGSIVLFHNNAKYVSEYLPIILERLQRDGYKIVPVSELIYKDNFYIDNSGKQIKKQ
ncbi:polysaccharide deacetylase family sporulation protein PdaB [Proteiniborus ethanoligenes]|uniref:Polysaccharide deacetylase family sporulation protein PdaB n=1 Tax=Proteiniborus ethanoligenes TaxID=415015 RepID=A0A1H3PAM1_9FIRM|nr:polysaccharide deacetylase family protein [Proteiniborus ethanoligenes]TAH59785.1 MAG: deacetylase [Gottschalkiaceae bacterium]SDY97983.1 polysaccharide deacetylase family sporulation protein PdaB [Proteiniborus ethanoligenes]